MVVQVLIAFDLMLDQLGTGMRELLQHHRQLPWVRETNHLLLSALDGFESRRIGRDCDRHRICRDDWSRRLLTDAQIGIDTLLARSFYQSIYLYPSRSSLDFDLDV